MKVNKFKEVVWSLKTYDVRPLVCLIDRKECITVEDKIKHIVWPSPHDMFKKLSTYLFFV